MDARSEQNLQHVHPDLCRVIRAAAQVPQPFIVIYGLRTEKAQREAVQTGHSTTMHSRHLPQSHEYLRACAVDIAALTHGEIDWARGREAAVYGQVAAQIKAAGHDLKIPVEWGGDWKSFKDWGHFQLPWSVYP